MRHHQGAIHHQKHHQPADAVWPRSCVPLQWVCYQDSGYYSLSPRGGRLLNTKGPPHQENSGLREEWLATPFHFWGAWGPETRPAPKRMQQLMGDSAGASEIRPESALIPAPGRKMGRLSAVGDQRSILPPSRLCFITDQTNHLRFLVGTGAEVSIIPPSHHSSTSRSTGLSLQAANQSSIVPPLP